MQGTTHLNLNSGLFYLAANTRTKALMTRIAARLAVEKVQPVPEPTCPVGMSMWTAGSGHTWLASQRQPDLSSEALLLGLVS